MVDYYVHYTRLGWAWLVKHTLYGGITIYKWVLCEKVGSILRMQILANLQTHWIICVVRDAKCETTCHANIVNGGSVW